jgi:hypothetical protein
MKYIVNHNYRAAFGEETIVLLAGQQVELEDSKADFVQRDSPGAISPISEAAPAAQDRMVRSGKTREVKGDGDSN